MAVIPALRPAQRVALSNLAFASRNLRGWASYCAGFVIRNLRGNASYCAGARHWKKPSSLRETFADAPRIVPDLISGTFVAVPRIVPDLPSGTFVALPRIVTKTHQLAIVTTLLRIVSETMTVATMV